MERFYTSNISISNGNIKYSEVYIGIDDTLIFLSTADGGIDDILVLLSQAADIGIDDTLIR